MNSWVEIFLPVILVLLAGAVGLTVLGERKRKKDLENLARDRGWSFEAVLNRELEGRLCDAFEFFGSAAQPDFKNAVLCRKPYGEIVVFDFGYVTGTGKSSSSHRQTVAAVISGALALPRFECHPGGRWASFFRRVFYAQKDINFPEDPVFSGRYVLSGPDEGPVRELFEASAIRQVLVRERDLMVLGRENLVGFGWPNVCCGARDWPRMFELAEEIHGVLKRTGI